MELMAYLTHYEGTPIDMASCLKQRGNEFFKQKLFSESASCYDKGIKILCFISREFFEYNLKSCSELSTSLILNFAACALKLHKYDKARDLFSFVLDYFPDNAKALYRRALALVQLRGFLQAKSDLSKALLVEPENKDILRELGMVDDHLLLNSNGKRCIDLPVSLIDGRKLKKGVAIQEACRLDTSPICSSSPSSVCSHAHMEISNSNNDISSNEVNYEKLLPENVTNQFLSFSNKGRKNSMLRIHVQTYNRLLHGKDVSYYQSSQFSTITIRILKKEQMVVESMKSSKNKRKKRRKGSRKKEHKVNEAPPTDFHYASSTYDVSYSASTTIKEVTLDHPQAFIFSSMRKTYRRFSVKRSAALDRSFAQSPASHNSPSFSPSCLGKSSKFLRSRNVSIFRRWLSTDY